MAFASRVSGLRGGSGHVASRSPGTQTVRTFLAATAAKATRTTRIRSFFMGVSVGPQGGGCLRERSVTMGWADGTPVPGVS